MTSEPDDDSIERELRALLADQLGYSELPDTTVIVREVGTDD